MRVAKDAAEAANRAKSVFLAAASHDLRQPAHALSLYLTALRGERHGERQAELVERMGESVAALDAMFGALLDLSRMDAGAVVPQVRPFPLEPMLHRLAAEFSHQAAGKEWRLSLEALRLVLAGGVYIPARTLGALHDSGRFSAGEASGLTPRQRDVLRLLGKGEPNKLIARQLGLTEGTVKIHIAAILRTLQARNRTEAVVRAREQGLEEPQNRACPRAFRPAVLDSRCEARALGGFGATLAQPGNAARSHCI